jgi:subtilisin family serine protease
MLETASTGRDQVAVIARVTDADLFDDVLNQVEGTRPGLRIGPIAGSDDDTVIVTARIPIREAPIIRERRDIVKSLKSSRRLQPHQAQLDLQSISSDVRAHLEQLPPGNSADGGRDVIVGIVDTGLNFTDERFRNEDGSTRLLCFWDQSAKLGPGSIGPQGYGRVHTRDEIDAALRTADPFKEIGYNLSLDKITLKSHHATIVADIALGSPIHSAEGEPPLATSIPGIAPNADIIFVELARTDVAIGNANALEATFGDSAQLLEAIAFIFDKAESEGKPCVINVSQGTSGGPHDGSSLVEEGIDRLVSQAPNRAVVVAAGNFFNKQMHASGTVPRDKPFDIELEIAPEDKTGNELEIWYSSEDHFEIEVIAPAQDGTPGGRTLARVDLGKDQDVSSGGSPQMFLVNRLKDSANGRNLINIFLESRLPSGRWLFRLRPVRVVDGRFNAWIERDEKRPSRFVNGNDDFTLNSIACGRKSIVVGAYSTAKEGMPPFLTTSAGPTLSAEDQPIRQKPELSAPGNVTSLPSFAAADNNFASGTSVSAAVVTGIVALLLAQAAHSGRGPLSIDEIREILIEAARTRKDATTGQEWNKQLGHGRVSASAALRMIM